MLPQLVRVIGAENLFRQPIAVGARLSTRSAWRPELLPCECVMRRPIASLCSAPMALGFDPDFDEGNVGTIVLSRDTMKK
jgi:hypothetical protein